MTFYLYYQRRKACRPEQFVQNTTFDRQVVVEATNENEDLSRRLNELEMGTPESYCRCCGRQWELVDVFNGWNEYNNRDRIATVINTQGKVIIHYLNGDIEKLKWVYGDRRRGTGRYVPIYEKSYLRTLPHFVYDDHILYEDEEDEDYEDEEDDDLWDEPGQAILRPTPRPF